MKSKCRFLPRYCPLFVVVALLATGCATIKPQTTDTIRAREAILFEGQACMGRLLRDTGAVSWEGCTLLMVTPTTLYHGQNDLSFATLQSVAVKPVKEWIWWPLGEPKMLEDMLVIEESRGVCWGGCVFRLVASEEPSEAGESPKTQRELAERVAALLLAQQSEIDPFGRTDGPRPVWISTGLARPPAGWQQEPHYLSKHHPNEKARLEDIFSAPSQSFPDRFGGLLAGNLAQLEGEIEREDKYTYVPLPDLRVNYRGHLDAGSVAAAVAENQTVLNSLLVSDLTRILLTEVISAQYEVRIKATFHLYYDFYDLDPMKNGAAYWYEYSITHLLENWLINDGELLRFELENATRNTAREIQRRLQHGVLDDI